MTSKHTTRAAGLAKSLLAVYDQGDYPEVLVHPSSVPKSMKRTRKYPNRDKGAALTVFPNPTSDYVIIRPEIERMAYAIRILDAQGRIVLEHPYDTASKSQIIPVSALSPAKYTINLIDAKGEVTETGTIVINR